VKRGVVVGMVDLLGLARVSRSRGDDVSWQAPQAKVRTRAIWSGRRSRCLRTRASVRYIDYEGGNDANEDQQGWPWKHHPWTAGHGQDAAARRAHLCVQARFVYAALLAKESGQAGDPIRLTSDPSWGRRACSPVRSRRRTGSGRGPRGYPQPDKVWWTDLGSHRGCVDGGKDGRSCGSRSPTPNWKVTIRRRQERVVVLGLSGREVDRHAHGRPAAPGRRQRAYHAPADYYKDAIV